MTEKIYIRVAGALVLKDPQTRDPAKRYSAISNHADGSPQVVEMTDDEQNAREAEEAAFTVKREIDWPANERERLRLQAKSLEEAGDHLGAMQLRLKALET